MEVVTDTPATVFGLGVEIIDAWPQPVVWVHRAGTRSQPVLNYGGLDVFNLTLGSQSASLTYLDSMDGSASYPLHPGVLTEWCPEPWTGRCDVLVGTPGSNEAGISAFTTITSTISYVGGVRVPGAFQLGKCLAEAGDLNGDFVPDIWGCAHGTLYAFSGKELRDSGGGIIGSSSIIHEIPAPEPGSGFPQAVMGDFQYNNDGIPDVIASAPYASPNGRFSAGAAYIFDGATGTLIRRFEGPMPGDQLGNSRNPFLLLGGIGPQDDVPSFGVAAPGHSATRASTAMITGTAGSGDLLMIFSRDPSPLTRFLAFFSPLPPAAFGGPAVR
jgi:hypothetical protein